VPYVTVNGEKLFYADHRDTLQRGPVVVLVHGAGGSHLDWPAELRRLPDVRLLALDLPGHGRSGGSGRNSVGAYRGDVSAFLDALDLTRVVLVGHSMGGAIVQDMALHAPARLAGIVLVATGAKLRVAPELLESLAADHGRAVDFIVTHEYASNAPEQLVRLGRARLLETRPDVLQGDYTACNAFDVMSELSRISVPTLLIGGTADEMTPPKYLSFLAERIPGAQLRLIDGSGHMVALEQPAVVAQAVSDFLVSLPQ
jgi:pimeloyl-ACP methyl ester carboxylesterase